MIRNLLKSAFILALLTLFFWLTDEKSQLNFTLNGTVYALSIPILEANTLQPTYLIPNNSNRPCIVPSSPYNPCKTGNITSICFKYSVIFSICSLFSYSSDFSISSSFTLYQFPILSI